MRSLRDRILNRIILPFINRTGIRIGKPLDLFSFMNVYSYKFDAQKRENWRRGLPWFEKGYDPRQNLTHWLSDHTASMEGDMIRLKSIKYLQEGRPLAVGCAHLSKRIKPPFVITGTLYYSYAQSHGWNAYWIYGSKRGEIDIIESYSGKRGCWNHTTNAFYHDESNELTQIKPISHGYWSEARTRLELDSNRMRIFINERLVREITDPLKLQQWMNQEWTLIANISFKKEILHEGNFNSSMSVSGISVYEKHQGI